MSGVSPPAATTPTRRSALSALIALWIGVSIGALWALEAHSGLITAICRGAR